MDDPAVSPTHTQVPIDKQTTTDLSSGTHSSNQHRQLADLHSRLATVEEKLGGEGTLGSGEEESKSRMPREN